MRRSLCVAMALALPATMIGSAQAQQATDAPWVWAAPALYGLGNSGCGKDVDSPETTAEIAPAFCSYLFPTDQRRAIGTAFAQAMARHFPHVEATFGQHLPGNATATQRLRGTLVASLRLTRATIAVVPKPLAVDAYMPLTLTLDVTNVANGEVVFTRTKTLVSQGSFAPGEVDGQLATQLPAKLSGLVEALVAEAAADFRPYAQSASVIGDVAAQQGRGYVVDKGRSAGLRAGDDLGDGHVIHAGADYAVVQSDLGPLHNGQVLTRTTLAPAEMLARPSLLVAVGTVPDGYAPDYVGQIFQDSLGAAGRFAPIPVNPSFVSLRRTALDKAGSAIPLDRRSTPEYVALLRVAVLPDVHIASNVEGITLLRFEAYAYASLVDSSGRVVGAWQGHGAIEDRVAGAMQFASATRRDSVMRNALTDLAQSMAGFRPQPVTAPVTQRDGHIVIIDNGGAVPLELTLPVLREAGRFHGLAAPVMVPVGFVTGTDVAANFVLADDAGVTPLSLRGNEVVALESAGTATRTRQVFAQCPGGNAERFDDRGSVQVATWHDAAENLLAARMTAPILLAELPGLLARYAPSFDQWSRFRPAQARGVDTCFVPVVSVAPTTAGTYDVTVGYTLHRGGAKIGSSGVRAMMTPTRLPPSASEADRAATLQADLARQVQAMGLKAAETLHPAP